MPYEGYCPITMIKERVLIPVEELTFDTALESAGTEASRIVDTHLLPYTTVPLVGDAITEQIKYICADIAAGLFKRRTKPLSPDEGWLGHGFRKLQDYVRNSYLRGKIT
jgi:hypothetical protein